MEKSQEKDRKNILNNLIGLDECLQFDRQEIRENYRRYINPSLAAALALLGFDKAFVRAEGEYIWDKEGNRYLDFLGGYGSVNTGHNPTEVLEAVKKAMGRPNMLQASLNGAAAALAHNLAQVTPGDLERVFFCNSGTEAVEGALKLARAANRGRNIILYCDNSFHGKSYGSLSVTGRQKYREPFEPLLPGCEAVPFGDLKALEERVAALDVAALIVEPIQGEGGVNVPPPGYLSGVREACDRTGTLLIIDEIQTGLGRTGRLFACEHEGVVPDIMCLAKSLGGSVMPVGAYIARPAIWDKVYGGIDKYAIHTTTFGGNTLAMAAGIAALQLIIEKDLPRQAAEKGEYLLKKLAVLHEKYGLLKEIRGQGLLIGLEFTQAVGNVLDKLTMGKAGEITNEYFGSLVAGELLNKHNVITAYTLNNPNVIRLEPPLTVSYESIDIVLNALEEIFKSSGFRGVMLSSVKTAIRSVIKRD